MFTQGVEIKLVVQPSGAITIQGPDLVEARPMWDYILAELAREIARRTTKAAESRLITPAFGVVVGDGKT